MEAGFGRSFRYFANHFLLDFERRIRYSPQSALLPATPTRLYPHGLRDSLGLQRRIGIMRILLVEDDSLIGEAVARALRDAAYVVDWVRDAPEAIAGVLSHEHEAVLLDLSLPGGDGIDILKLIRKSDPDIPVLIVTARDAIEDRIRGLDLGANDYLVKPFDTAELLARLRAAARRLGGHADAILSTDELTLDQRTHIAAYRGTQATLSAREFGVLRALLTRPGTILSRAKLEQSVYGDDDSVDSNAIEYLIFTIRKKLGAGAIRNVRGVGWMVSSERSQVR